MCYDIKASLESQLKRAKRKGDAPAIEEILEKLVPLTDLPLFHVSGFSHPELFIYTNESPEFPTVATWGLVPHWVKSEADIKKQWNNTLNARGETIFKKPSFRTSAVNNRCLIYVDGFYEHHHFKGNTYPFYIFRKDKQPMALAGLWSEWRNPDTGGILKSFSIVTTSGNALLSKIHNNPKLKASRMPVILPTELEDNWLKPINDELDIKEIQNLILEYPDDELDAHTVSKLRGKEYQGNVKSISDKVNYSELKF
ncbi:MULTISPECIES: SOS response-associated peptidase [Aequorivita]|uniref:Abasic site processing protein n=2 Tax=Aequorivita TaxID=153265 RepID=A0AB35YNJ4_9FLAO|nr:SOS response-associated peptidase [Aequorivita sp. Ant34-E75]WGF91942.1 SOS response-associated peptidase [Aequorivita sp. Ant34-E75]